MDKETPKKVGRYFKNLLIALLGSNPYAIELQRTQEDYKKTGQVVEKQREQIYTLDTKLAQLTEQVSGFKNLTENLRERVNDKNIALDAERRERVEAVRRLNTAHEMEVSALKKKLEEQVDERDEKIAALREDLDGTLEQLQRANQALGRNCMAQAMLDKTNNGLKDLIAAMQHGDEEKMAMASQYLDWSSYLAHIAQLHLQVLRRRNELVARLHFTEQTRDDDNVNYD